MSSHVTTEEELLSHYGAPHPDMLRKQIDHLDEHARRWIAASPFLLLATLGPGGLDVSPKGDAPGFVRVLDERTLLLPDRPGNRRLDGLRNILADPRVGLLFLVPGRSESFRVNGRAAISLDNELRTLCAQDGKPAMSVIRIAVEEVFLHCGRSLRAADPWNPATHRGPDELAAPGTVLKAHLELAERQR